MEIKLVDEQSFCYALEIYKASWIESHRRICNTSFLENRDYEGFLRKKMGTLWLISDTIPVGVFSLTEENFGDLYIRPDCQGRGYGTACIRFAMETMPRLRLTVLSDNRAAIALYEKMNFRFTGNDALLRDGLWEREMVYTEN